MPAGNQHTKRRNIAPLLFLMGCVSLLIYFQLPEIIKMLSSAAPSFAWEVFYWVKPESTESLAALCDKPCLESPEILFVELYAGLFFINAFAVRSLKGEQSSAARMVVFGSAAVFMSVFLISSVMLSTDIYAYGFYGRLVSLHGADAYGVDDDNNYVDPYFDLFGHKLPSVYGPLWTAVSALLTRMGGEHMGLTVLLFRGLACASALGSGALIWSILRRIAPERALQGTAFFLWNPLMITETALSGHNDIVMMVFVLLAVWLHLQGRRACAALALTLSALVKFVSGPLIPLYWLMTMRESKCWKERIFLTARSVPLACATGALVFFAAQVKTAAPTGSYATAPDFYSNNFHELIFKGLRLWFGENPVLVHTPIYSTSWWVKTRVPVELRENPHQQSRATLRLNAGARLLTVGNQSDDDWLYVYDPPSKTVGYVMVMKTTAIATPPDSELDSLSVQIENGPMEWPTVLKANKVVRIVTYLSFAVFGLFAAWRTSRFEKFLLWGPTVIIAMYFTIMTQLWPWYLIWALALGALLPGSSPFKLAGLLSFGVMTLYCTIGYEGGDWPWVFHYRSVFAVLLPTLFFVGCWIWEKCRVLKAKRTALNLPMIEPEMMKAPEVLIG